MTSLKRDSSVHPHARPRGFTKDVQQQRANRIFTVLVLLGELSCLLWLVWILALTANPTAMVNKLMDTEDFDDGTFWLLSTAPRAVVLVGVIGLACVGIVYIVCMGRGLSLMKRGRAVSPSGRSESAFESLRARVVNATDALVPEKSVSFLRTASRNLTEMLDKESKMHQHIASGLKIVEILCQCVVLTQALEDGMPIALCVLLGAIVVANAAMSCVFAILPSENMGRIHLFVDASFDLAIAVGSPFVSLRYAKNAFNFDRSTFALNQKIFPPGVFETIANVIADPVRVEMIRHVLDSLRINSALKVITCVEKQYTRVKQYPNVYPRRNRFYAAIYGLLFVMIAVCTEESMRTSQQACAMHPECVQYAHRWIYGRESNDQRRCPCIAIIDRNLKVAKFDEWVHPMSREWKVGQLAVSGFLQTLQLVNRGLETIPEELRGCTNLKHLSLYYTGTKTLPEWFGELVNIEFLHIEGRATGETAQESLRRLPANLFDKMDKLLFLHLSQHFLSDLPSFDGLASIQSITLVSMANVLALPSLDKLYNLERLQVLSMPSLRTLPPLDNLVKLRALTITDRGEVCCNGYLGNCDLTKPACSYSRLWQMPAVAQCVGVDEVATPATKAAFNKFRDSICQYVLDRTQAEGSPTLNEMLQCNGTMYRQCDVPDYGVGLCYNSRWLPVACRPSRFAVAMRRQQIALKIGEPCDPEVEAWLGC